MSLSYIDGKRQHHTAHEDAFTVSDEAGKDPRRHGGTVTPHFMLSFYPGDKVLLLPSLMCRLQTAGPIE